MHKNVLRKICVLKLKIAYRLTAINLARQKRRRMESSTYLFIFCFVSTKKLKKKKKGKIS